MPTLHWIGKEKVINHHRDVPFRTLEHKYHYPTPPVETGLRPVSTPIWHTQTNDVSGNKIIHGDNLEALKSLLPEYEGRIKCICIDPPYNTGNENWIYNDNVNDPKIKKWLSQVVGKEGEDLSRHDKWLCMMYPRLQLLRQLLAENGSLVISIGYQEVTNLMLICKELFSDKQIVCVTVQTSGGKPAGGFNYQHEYLVFIVPNEFEPNPLLFSGGISRTPWEGLTLSTFDKTQRPNQTYPIYVNVKDGSIAGIGESLQERVKNKKFTGKLEDFQFNFEEAPAGTVAVWPITSKGKDCVWRLISARLLNDWEKGYIKISPNRSKDSKNQFSIQYLPEGVIKKIESGLLEVIGKEENLPTLSFGENKTVGSEIPTLWLEKSFYSVKGTTLINDIFEKKQFNYPKPIELITEVLRAISSPDDIILDSFAGSGTTAHAVLNLNREDGGNRKFILIEMEEYAETITAERVKRVIKAMYPVETHGNASTQIPTFDYYELGDPLFVENNLNPKLPVEKIREYIYFMETKQRLPATDKKDNKYLLGVNSGVAYYFFYNPKEDTELDYAFLKTIKTKADEYIIYADNCLLTTDFLQSKRITFKKIPREIPRI